MLRTVLAGLRYRKARLALSSLAITLGVAFVAGTLTMSTSMNRTFFTSFAAGAKNVDVIVAARDSGSPPGQYGGPALPASTLAAVRSVPGVADAAGRLTGAAALVGSDGKATGKGIGVNVTSVPSLDGFSLVSGHLASGPGQVDIDKATAADEHFRLGQRVRVVLNSGTVRTFRLAGTIDLGVNAQIGNAAVMAFTTPVAISVTGTRGYGLIAVRAAPGVSQATLAARIRARLPGYVVQTGSQFGTEEANSTAKVAQQFTSGLLIFALIALAVACIVVYNTLSILVAQRSAEFALLRCAGASRRQVFLGVIAESAAVGLVASAAGVLAGIGLSWGLGRLFLAGLGGSAPPAPLTVSPSAVAIAAGTGLAVTVVTSLLPARAATQVAPVTALGSAAAPTVTRRAGWLRVTVAAVTGAAGVLLTVAAPHSGGPRSAFLLVAAGGCACFVALFALMPLIAPPVIGVLGWLAGLAARLGGTAGRGAGVTVRLATANGRRNPHRVAATTAALTIGITLMTVFTVVFSSLQASTDAAIAGHFPFDYIVRASGAQTVPPRVVRALQSSPDLAVAAPEYLGMATVGKHAHVPVGAYGHGALSGALRPAMVSGSLGSAGGGDVAVDSAMGVRAGQALAVSTPDAGTLRLRVVAVYDASKYKSPLPAVLMSVPDYLRGFRPAGADEVVIDAARGVPAAASRAAVDAAIASDPALVADTLADYKASLNHNVNQILEMLAALLGLAVLIALLGIASTLTLSVIERTRESALMRALGLTRGQLRRMLLAEALLMAGLAVLLGVSLGAGFGIAMTEAFVRSAHGAGVLSIPYARLGLYAVVSACAALAAAVLPARRAARVSVVSAMADT